MKDFTLQLDGMSVVKKAQVYAMAAHAAVGQRRKYTNEPYIVHPAEVAKMVADIPSSTEDMVAAAWLHDVIEDTGCTFTDVHMGFGIDIAILVNWLTDVSKPEDGNRARRKQIDLEHTAQAPAEAQTIKVCDIISNIRSIVEHDEAFARVYVPEKRRQLEILTKAEPDILARAYKELQLAEQRLQI